MEYGTVPVLETLQALRGEHWLNVHPQAPPELAARIKQQMKDAFYTDTDEWKGKVLRQGREALFQAADGLAAEGLCKAGQEAKRRCAISSRPSKIRLSTSSKGTDMCGAIFQPAPPVMKQAGSAPQCLRTCCTMRSIAPAIA